MLKWLQRLSNRESSLGRETKANETRRDETRRDETHPFKQNCLAYPSAVSSMPTIGEQSIPALLCFPLYSILLHVSRPRFDRAFLPSRSFPS